MYFNFEYCFIRSYFLTANSVTEINSKQHCYSANKRVQFQLVGLFIVLSFIIVVIVPNFIIRCFINFDPVFSLFIVKIMHFTTVISRAVTVIVHFIADFKDFLKFQPIE